MGQNIPGSSQVDALRAQLTLKGSSGGGGATGATGPQGVTGATGAQGATGPGGNLTLTGGAVGGPSAIPGTVATVLNRIPLGFTTLFIDPANSTGFASDSNTGANETNSPPGTGPILTTAHLNQLIFQKANTPFAAVTITYMSDDSSGTLLDWSTFQYNNGTVTITGTSQVQATTTAVAVTAMNEQANTFPTLQLGIDPTPYIETQLGGTGSFPFYVKVTSGANTGTTAWIISATGGSDTVFISLPVTSSTSRGTISAGDPLEICRGSTIEFGANLTTSSLFATNFTVVEAGGSSSDQFEFTQCGILGSYDSNAAFIHCFTNGFIGFDIAVQYGVYNSQFNNTFNEYDSSTFFSIGGACIVTGAGLLAGSNGHEQFTVFDGGSGFGVGFLNCTSTIAALQIYEDTSTTGAGTRGALLWGHGNAGAGVAVAPGATLTVAASPEAPLLTGTGGDFVFLAELTSAPISTGRAWNEGSGVYTAPISTTWAHLATTIVGGGFGGNAQNVSTAAAVVML